jgi:hypothetical protein
MDADPIFPSEKIEQRHEACVYSKCFGSRLNLREKLAPATLSR